MKQISTWRSGFSLMEMMVVLLIVSIVAAASAPMVSKKMVRSAGENSSPWVWVGSHGSIAYNMNGAPASTMSIGALTDESKANSRVYIKDANDNPHNPFITLGNGGQNYMKLRFANNGLAFAEDDTAPTQDSLRIGIGTETGANSVALGRNAKTGATSIAIGKDAQATGEGSVSIASNANTGNSNVAIGRNSQITSNAAFAVVVGPFSETNSDNTVTIGASAENNAAGGISIGEGTNVEGVGGIAIGSEGDMDLTPWAGDYGVAIGAGATGNTNAVALGRMTEATANSIAIGNSANTDGDVESAIAMGNSASAGANSGIAIGRNANATSNQSIAIGSGLFAQGGAFNVDLRTIAADINSIAIGPAARTTRTDNTLTSGGQIAIGHQATANDQRSIAIGWNTRAADHVSTAIGARARAYNASTIAIGVDAVAGGTYNDQGNHNAAQSTPTNGSVRAIAIGVDTQSSGQSSIAIGTNAIASGHSSVAIGPRRSGGTPIAENGLGANTEATHYNSTAIGAGAKTTANQQIVLGTALDTVYIPGRLVVDGDTWLAVNKGSNQNTGTMHHVYVGASDNTPTWNTHHIRQITTAGLFMGGFTNGYPYPSLSDRRLKNVGEVFKGGLEEIRKLEIFNYTFKKDPNKTPRVGVMAQDLQKIFPDAVTKGDDGFLRIRMEDMFYALVNAVKELDEKITALAEQIKSNLDRTEVLEKTVQSQQEVIEQLQLQNKELVKQNEAFEKRLAKLEKKNKE